MSQIIIRRATKRKKKKNSINNEQTDGNQFKPNLKTQFKYEVKT